jgi:hypothetical protein
VSHQFLKRMEYYGFLIKEHQMFLVRVLIFLIFRECKLHILVFLAALYQIFLRILKLLATD